MKPKDWKTYKVKDLGVILKGKGILKSEVTKEGNPCIRYGEIYTTYDKYFEHTVSFINDITALQSQIVKKGDILFAGSGETAEEIGKCTAYIGDSEIYAGGDIIILRPSKDNSIFLSYILNSHDVNKQKSILGQGHSVVHIYPKGISELEIALPPKNEQDQIAKILVTLNNNIDKTRSLISKKEIKKNILLHKLLTAEIRFKEFAEEDIVEGKFSDYVDLLHGYQFRKEDFTKEGIPVIKISNVIGHDLNLNDPSFIAKERLNEFRDVLIENGDLLMSLTGNIGRVVHVRNINYPIVQNYRVGKFVTKDEKILSKEYLRHLLGSDLLTRQFINLSNQSAQANFGKQDMDKLWISFTSNIEEQKKIANVLTAADDEIQILKAQLQKLNMQKKGLMQLLLTGKMRVRI